MTEKNMALKGFRTPPQPTKAEVQKENATLAQQLAQRIQGLQTFFGNLINQLMRQSKTHEQELSQVSLWLAGKDTDGPSEKGDHLLMDYIGVLLAEDGSDSKVTVETAEGSREIPDYFDGGAGKLFMLTNLGGGTLIPGFEEQLIGLKAGEGKEIQVKFPDDYAVPSLKGKTAKFTVYVHAVKRVYANSSVGDLIDENQRIRDAVKAKALADAQAKAAEAKAAKEEKKEEALSDNKGPGADSVPAAGEAQLAEAPAPEQTPAS